MARAYLFGGLATFGRLLAQSAEKGKLVRLIFAHFSTGENSGMPVVLQLGARAWRVTLPTNSGNVCSGQTKIGKSD